jgi:hypothetical protein
MTQEKHQRDAERQRCKLLKLPPPEFEDFWTMANRLFPEQTTQPKEDKMKAENETESTQGEAQEIALNSWRDTILNEAAEWGEKARAIIVKDENDKETMKQASETRKAIKKIRVAVENRRKELTQSLTRQKSTIDSVAREIKAALEPLESYLETQEKFAEIKAEKEKAERFSNRSAALFGLIAEVPAIVSDMTDADFEAYLSGLKDQEKKRKEAAEAEAHAAELKRQEEQKELERLRIQAEADRKAREEAEAEAKKQREEREKAEREAKEAQEKAEREAKEAREAQEKAEREAEKAKTETAQVLANPFAAPKALEQIEMFDPFAPPADLWESDKAHFQSFAEKLFAHKFPEMKSERGKSLAENVESLKRKLFHYIHENI